MHFKDTTNGLCADFVMGNVNGKTSDYFQGEIVDADGNTKSTFRGSYLSYLEFDGVRYWDIRRNIDIEPYPVKPQLKSGSIYREDSLLLYERKLDEGQEAKDKLENLQRHDRKMRAELGPKKEEE